MIVWFTSALGRGIIKSNKICHRMPESGAQLSSIWNLAENQERGKYAYSATEIDGIKSGRILQTLFRNLLLF